MSSLPLDLDVVSSGFHLTAGKYVGMASLAMVIYDHVLTFPREVERIWKQRITGATVLFLLNRYITPLQYIIFMDAYLDPRWTKEACDEFVVFEGAATAALVGVGELIMILRVYAFYGQSRNILCFLMVLWTCQIIISGVGLSTGFAVPFPPMLTGCILTGTSDTFPMIWAAPAVTDTFIFVLTLWRTRQLIRQSGKNATLELFLRDGIMYFFVIFMANLGNTLIYYLSPDDTKAVGAAFSQAITAVMVSRLVLNLRPFTAGANTTIGERTSGLSSSFIGGNHQPPDHSFMTRSIIGNLGSEFDTFQSYSFDAGQDVSDLRRADPENLDREFW
ncbi:hypothetical protein B0H34DRAFT_212451 [Crassisporium funariophilum]|nr:hypothetical protein B0H34DRAFT_212451 [Crassisporium funariophilum]